MNADGGKVGQRGCALAFALLLMTLWLRPDWPDAIGLPMVWVKMGFTLTLATAGRIAVCRLSTLGLELVGLQNGESKWSCSPRCNHRIAAGFGSPGQYAGCIFQNDLAGLVVHETSWPSAAS